MIEIRWADSQTCTNGRLAIEAADDGLLRLYLRGADVSVEEVLVPAYLAETIGTALRAEAGVARARAAGRRPT